MFIKFFFGKDADLVTKQDLEVFTTRRIEENLNLDYKEIQAFDNPDELSKDISAFANSEGGLIILGVSEEKAGTGAAQRILPGEITWGDASLSREKLENRLVGRIHPKVGSLGIVPIREGSNSARVVFLIDVSQSDDAPHMASDSRYYKRLNFQKVPMEHHEVANLFRINWTMKEKLVEKIYEPLSSVLEKHAKELMDYSGPSVHEIHDIMSKTYYKTQMPAELVRRIGRYVRRLEDFYKEEYFARELAVEIANRNLTDYLKEKCGLQGKDPIVFDYVAIRSKSGKCEIKLDCHLIHRLILTNQEVGTYVREANWREVYDEVLIPYRAEQYRTSLRDFDKLVWGKCLKEASGNSEIVQMRQDAEVLSKEAWRLIGEITSH